MHLVRGMTSLNTRKRKQKGITQADRDAKVKHEKFLRKHGVHPDQLKKSLPHDAKGRRLGICKIPNYKSDIELPTLSNDVGNGFARKQNVYTGDQIVGIATMHKSNAVPIRKDSKAAEEIARMRR